MIQGLYEAIGLGVPSRMPSEEHLEGKKIWPHSNTTIGVLPA